MKNKLVWAAAAAFLAASTAGAADYTVTNLSTLYGADFDMKFVNNAGDVATSAGTVFLHGGQSVSYTPGSDIHMVSTTALANDGTVYLVATANNYSTVTSRLNTDGTLTTMPMLPQTGSRPGRGLDAVYAVNDHGVAVGEASNGDGTCYEHCEWFSSTPHATIFKDGQAVDIGHLGGNQAVANSINNHGVVVGNSPSVAGGRRDAFIYEDGKMSLLRSDSLAERINDAGQVAGTSYHGENWNTYQTAFLYQDGKFTDIALDGFRNTEVIDLNNAGQLLGLGRTLTGEYANFVYEDGKTLFLEDVFAQMDGYDGWTFGKALDINDKGQILVSIYKPAEGYYDTDYLLLTPGAVAAVPEPGTWAMLFAGLGILGFAGRRRPASTRGSNAG